MWQNLFSLLECYFWMEECHQQFSPRENTDVDLQIHVCLGLKRQVRRRKLITKFTLQTFLACRTARQVETKLTQLELILSSERQRTVGASIMNQAAAFCCERKLRKCEVVLTP